MMHMNTTLLKMGCDDTACRMSCDLCARSLKLQRSMEAEPLCLEPIDESLVSRLLHH